MKNMLKFNLAVKKCKIKAEKIHYQLDRNSEINYFRTSGKFGILHVTESFRKNFAFCATVVS